MLGFTKLVFTMLAFIALGCTMSGFIRLGLTTLALAIVALAKLDLITAGFTVPPETTVLVTLIGRADTIVATGAVVELVVLVIRGDLITGGTGPCDLDVRIETLTGTAFLVVKVGLRIWNLRNLFKGVLARPL